MPIDAGKMLPPECVFDGNNPEGFPNSEGLDAPIRSDTEVPAVGMHMLMQLPQAKEPFDKATIDKIEALDPKAVLMKGSDSKRKGDMAGKIGDDTFQLVEESVHFLKLVVSQTSPPMANVIGKLYAIPEGFKAFKTERRKLGQDPLPNGPKGASHKGS